MQSDETDALLSEKKGKMVAMLQEGIMSEYEKNNILLQRCVDEVYNEETIKRVPSVLNGTAKAAADDIKCTLAKVVSLESVLVFPICIYDASQDKSISASLLFPSQPIFEEKNLLSTARWLNQLSDHGLIDIGANIGWFTMMAATLEFPVVAVEPRAENILRMQKAVGLRELGDRVTLIYNAVSDVRGRMRMLSHRKEQGRTIVVCEKNCRDYDDDICLDAAVETILMDDLLGVITFRKAIMKIDVEGHEIRAFAKSDLLFKKILISLILMEWTWRQNFQSRTESDKSEVEGFIDLLLSRGYQPQAENGKVLDIRRWDYWPTDVFWVLQRREVAVYDVAA